MYLSTRKNALRKVVILSIGLETAAVALRVIPTIFYNPHHDSKQPPWYMIPCVHLGQICNAAVGPLVMATCTLLSATWFPSNERGTATSIAVIANNSKFFFVKCIQNSIHMVFLTSLTTTRSWQFHWFFWRICCK